MSRWRVVCKNYWQTITFVFETLDDAGRFLSEFIARKEQGDDKDGRKWTYCIEPIETEEDEIEDDIPVQ